MVYVVGLGPGSKEYILPRAIKVLESSDIVIGFNRAMESLNFISTEKIVIKGITEILGFITNNEEIDVAIVASGDPCFHGIVDYITRNYKGRLEVIPGISSFQYLTAKLRKPWQSSFLGSLHGRREEFIEKVIAHKLSIWLTDKTHTPAALSKLMVKEGISARVYVGENLSYEDERIIAGTAAEVAKMTFSDLNIVIIERE